MLKLNNNIQMNLDTKPMAKAVSPSPFPIPTPQELQHNFWNSDRFTVADLNHGFHQSPMDEASQDLFTFLPHGVFTNSTCWSWELTTWYQSI